MATETRYPADRNGDRNRIRPHKKSRDGCFNCKRRKVKCDEEKPTCTNCVRFDIPCRYLSSAGDGSWRYLSADVTPPPTSEAEAKPPQASPPRRGRGRPRKNWAAVAPPSAGSASTPTPGPPSPSKKGVCSLNVWDSELLLHYVSTTAATFVQHGADKPDDPIVKFWTHNAPRVGLAHHFVLHLLLAVAGFHLSYLHAASRKHELYRSLAGDHLSTGLAEMTEVLAKPSDDSYGPLYVGATLVCYCTFASGPTGGGDLLVTDVEDEARWLPLILGLRYIRQAADPEKLWSGLLAPLAPSGDAQPLDSPVYLRDGFPRVDWVGHFKKLGELVAEEGGENSAVYSRSFDALRGIYAAVYGDGDGRYGGPPENQFIHGWLYRVEDAYVACLRRLEPLALILLAHFALLLRTMDDWYLEGWADHLLRRTREYVPDHLEHWVRWPTEQAGLRDVDSRNSGAGP